MWTSRRERIVISIFIVTFVGYVIYLIGLQSSSLRLASEFKEYINLREHIDFLHTVGHIESGVLGVGLAASILMSYRNGSLDRTFLTYALAGILALSSVIVIGLNLYYQYIINLLGL